MMTGILHFTPVALMVSVVAMNHLMNNQRADKKLSIEASGLRSALSAELRALLAIYEKNLELIKRKADYILSTRSSVVIYRGNLGRLTTLLDASVIEQIVGIFAQNERIEAVVAAHSNFKCNITYQFSPADADYDEWKRMFEQAIADIADAFRILEDDNHCSVPETALVGFPKPFKRLVQQPYPQTVAE